MWSCYRPASQNSVFGRRIWISVRARGKYQWAIRNSATCRISCVLLFWLCGLPLTYVGHAKKTIVSYCFFKCQFSFVLFSVKPENVQLLTNITENNTCPGGYWNFTCSVGAVNPQVTSYQLLENDIAVDASSSGMWMRTLLNSGVFTYKCLANNTVGSTISANEKKIAISGNSFTHIFSTQNVTVCSIWMP